MTARANGEQIVELRPDACWGVMRQCNCYSQGKNNRNLLHLAEVCSSLTGCWIYGKGVVSNRAAATVEGVLLMYVWVPGTVGAQKSANCLGPGCSFCSQVVHHRQEARQGGEIIMLMYVCVPEQWCAGSIGSKQQL